MTVQDLELINFRNYENQKISFGNGINILYGQNAQGKTNILEALYIASTGKSHRTNNYHDLIKYNCEGFELRLRSNANGRENSIRIKYSREKGRFLEINGIKRDKISDVLGTLNMILFSPETLDVVKGSPAERRKFLDILLCQTDRQYLYILKRYNKLIKNKAAALKKWKNEKKYEDIFSVWNEHIAALGAKISYLRMIALKKLDGYMKEEIKSITSGLETSVLQYKTYCEFDEDSDEDFFREKLSEKLKNGIEKELNISQCLYGPHRDDFEILLNDLNSRQFCSQGQQRTLALSLILAELFYTEEIKDEKPVLLLDDVLSELDLKRQEYLLRGLSDVQTIITTTDDLPFEKIKDKDIKRFLIREGTVYISENI
ncbi:MAG TPA: DNA replication/repair protein RecF [Clostridiaceae bacterium]|nr:DNA replication/repair protein RecF [Clostridiaceae bacterium]